MANVEIRIAGHIDPSWAEWLDGFTLTHLPEGQTLLVGTVSDQAGLYGLISKLRDLGAVLISVHYGNDPPLEFPA
ncbi:MAG: hypothetical protein ACK2T7_04630 [Anaerolineales bacterium]|jgi:hypothetical protein